MAFTQGFENDVFISYAHVDNRDNWVDEFHRQLQNRLNQLDLRGCPRVTTWRDPKLTGADHFSSEIYDQLKNSATLISVITPSCIHSEWCKEERRRFEVFATVNGGFRIENKLRAIHVVRMPLDKDLHQELFPSLGFNFYQRDQGAEEFREHPTSSAEFSSLVLKLAQTLLTVLKLVNSRPAQRSAVYVSLAAPNMEETRSQIVNELSALKIPVLPTKNFVPTEAPGFRKAVEVCLRECRLSVHFGSSQPGPVPEGEVLPAAVLQYQMATRIPLPRVVWMQPGAEIAEDFRSCLKQTGLEEAQFLDSPNLTIVDLKREVEARINMLDRGSSGRSERDTGGSVYLLGDGAEYPYIPVSGGETISGKAAKDLIDKGFTVWLPPVNIKEGQLRGATHKETVSDQSWAIRRTSDAAKGNPFPGLRSFRPEQAGLFFGRDGEVRELIGKLGLRRLVAVVGVSGIGKSSVVAAGLIPRLAEGFMQGTRWRFASMKPGNSPIEALSSSLSKSLKLDFDDVFPELKRSSRGLGQLIADKLTADENLLIVVDQFEELMRFQQSEMTSQEGEAASQFVELLLGATGHGLIEPASSTAAKVFVVLTMRSEYLGKCTRFPGLAEALNEGQFLLPRLGRHQLTEIIQGPVAMAGGRVTAELVQHLLNGSADERAELPLLQFALRLMWEKSASDREAGRPIDIRHYEAIGGSIITALNKFADDKILTLTNRVVDGDRIVRELFQRLVESGRTDEEVRRPTKLKELATVTHTDETILTDVTKTLSDIGLITISSDKDSEIDITHESLIREWETLKKWATEEATAADIYQRLAKAAAQKPSRSLYSGLDLRQALQWYSYPRTSEAWKVWARRYDVNGSSFEQAHDFLEASIATSGRLRHVAELAASFFVGLLCMIGILWLHSESLSKTTMSQWLAAGAEEWSRGPVGLTQRSLLVGIESLKRNQSAAADRVIRSISSYVPIFVSQMSHRGPITSLVFSPDAKTLMSGSEDKTFGIWDAKSGKVLRGQPLTAKVRTVEVDSSGKYLVTVARDDSTIGPDKVKRLDQSSLVQVWAIANPAKPQEVYGVSLAGSTAAISLGRDQLMMTDGTTLRSVQLTPTLEVRERPSPKGERFEFTPDNKLLVAEDHQFVQVYDLGTGNSRTLSLTGQGIQENVPAKIAVSGNGQLLGTFARLRNRDGTVSGHFRQWSLRPPGFSGIEFELDGYSLTASLAGDLSLSRTGDFVALSTPANGVVVWNANTGKPIGEGQASKRSVDSHPLSIHQFSHSGKALAVSAGDGTIQIFNLNPWRESFRVGTNQIARAFAWSNDDRTVAVGTEGGLITVWSLTEGPDAGQVNARTFAYSPGGGYAVIEAPKDHIEILDVKQSEILDVKQKAVLAFGGNSYWAYTFSPDEEQLAWIDREKRTFSFYDLRQRKQLCSTNYSGNLVNSTFSRSGRFLTVTSDGQLSEWDGTDCARIRTLQLGKFGGEYKDLPSKGAYFSSGGKFLILDQDFDSNEMVVWNLIENRIIGKIPALSSWGLVFSPDESKVAGMAKGYIVCWETSTAQMVWRKEVQYVSPLFTFDPTGTRLAWAAGSMIAVGDIRTRTVLFTDDDTAAEVQALTFDRSGEYLASAWSSNRIRIQRLKDGFQVNEIPMNVSRSIDALLRFAPSNTFLVAQDDTSGSPSSFRAFWWKRDDVLREACRRVASNLSSEEWRHQVGVDVGRSSLTCPTIPSTPSTNSGLRH